MTLFCNLIIDRPLYKWRLRKFKKFTMSDYENSDKRQLNSSMTVMMTETNELPHNEVHYLAEAKILHRDDSSRFTSTLRAATSQLLLSLLNVPTTIQTLNSTPRTCRACTADTLRYTTVQCNRYYLGL